MKAKKKFSIIIIIVASLLFITGVSFLIYGFYLNDWLTLGLVTYETVDLDYTTEKEFDNIEIDLNNSKLEIVTGDSFLVEYTTRKDKPMKVEITDGTLAIIESDQWWFGFNIPSKKLSVKITLPDKLYGKCNIDTNNGEVILSNSKLNSLMVEANNGSIKLTNSVITETAELDSTNGSISMLNITAKNIKADTTNGSIKTDSCVVKETISVESRNGTLKLYYCVAENIIMDTTNGKIEVESKVTNLDAKTTNGSINFHIEGLQSNYDVFLIKRNKEDYYPSETVSIGRIKAKTTNGGITLVWI